MFELMPFRRRNSELQNYDGMFDMDDFFEDFFNRPFFPPFYRGHVPMKVDIKETDKEYVVEADLPGAKKDEINLQLDEDRLTISVNKDAQSEEEKSNYIRRERSMSTMSRSFALSNVKVEDVKAKFDNGVLSIILPKREYGNGKGKQIEIE
ncbi:Hsp20/alpha crystallin family protein [Desulfitobacterium sp.]|uniref:Hsp20/alpha crystallin family protein n=1 Tax=Desulfitobacterium sp. TaxID=49981 RepID=UPI002B1F3455|nr:Hsp20/alpha crystallin family protein [Desulfitobacterium sp.]MEA4902966.1 Hsp20/alpha crystallin family protein [Desulfitobacterium sp.]